MDEYGFMELDDLVAGSTSELASWFSANRTEVNDISDRNSIGFGTICPWISMPDGSVKAFVLTPVLATPRTAETYSSQDTPLDIADDDPGGVASDIFGVIA